MPTGPLEAFVDGKAPRVGDKIPFFQEPIDAHLKRLSEKRVAEFVQDYAHRPDGTPDTALEQRIRLEVNRRASMGRELDIYEPIRWTALSFALSAAAGVGIKMTTDKHFSRPALTTLLISTAINSAIQLVRLVPRYDAGLHGGLDTALAMHAYDRECQALTHNWASRVQSAAPAPSWTAKVSAPAEEAVSPTRLI